MQPGVLDSVPRVERLESRQFLSAATPTSYLINCGGAAYTDHNGKHWSADEDFSGGGASDNVYNVPGTSDDVVFYDRRTGTNFKYNLPIADGTYTVELFFTDPIYSAAGQRVFNVTAEGKTELSHFDIIAAGGGRPPLPKTFTVSVSDGTLTLGFNAVVAHATISGIQVSSRATPTPTPTPTPAPTPTPPPTPTPTPTPTGTATSGDFLYVFDAPENIQGSRGLKQEIEVYNIGEGNKWVKNIPLPNNIYNIRGVAANAATGRLYIAFLDGPADGVFPGGLLCMNLNTNAVMWKQNYPASVTPSVDRFDLTPDGKTIYLPVGEGATQDFVTVINAATGATEGRVLTPASSHDLISNGQYTFVEGQEKGPEGAQFHHSIAVIDNATNQVVKTIGPFNNVVRPFTVNAGNTLVYATENNFIGFQIASVVTGKVLFTVPVPGRSQDLAGGNIVNHGISITPDGKYLYLVDTSRDGVYAFNVSGAGNGIAPTYLKFIPTRKPGDNPAGRPDPAEANDPTGLPGWIMSSYNGQYMYTEGGDVISTATNTVVGNLRAETTNSSGKLVLAPYTHSRSMIEVDFSKGLAVRTTDQFGIGHD